jgi:3-phenylpropionate/trans-cinnamate dioxygenase ferredoxin subunit
VNLKRRKLGFGLRLFQFNRKGFSMADFRTVANTGDLNPGEATIVDYGRMSVILFNIDGEYFAIEDRCSHEEVELSSGTIDLANCRIQCAKHGAEFDIKTGEVLSPPAIAPVKTFDVQIDGTNIQITPRR